MSVERGSNRHRFSEGLSPIRNRFSGEFASVERGSNRHRFSEGLSPHKSSSSLRFHGNLRPTSADDKHGYSPTNRNDR